MVGTKEEGKKRTEPIRGYLHFSTRFTLALLQDSRNLRRSALRWLLCDYAVPIASHTENALDRIRLL